MFKLGSWCAYETINDKGECIYVGHAPLISALQDHSSYTNSVVVNLMLQTVELHVRILLTCDDEKTAANYAHARLRQYHDIGSVPVCNTLPRKAIQRVMVASSDGHQFTSMRKCAEFYGVPLARVDYALRGNGWLSENVRIQKIEMPGW